MPSQECPACTFGHRNGEFCDRHRIARERRLPRFLNDGTVLLPERRYHVNVTYGEGWGEEFEPWTDKNGVLHEPFITRITTATTLVDFRDEPNLFSLYADSEGANINTATAENSARRTLDWTYHRKEGTNFVLISNWLEATTIPTRDPNIWGVDFRGYGLWGASSVGRTAFLCTDQAEFLERDLMDIVGVISRDEWDTGLGPTIATDSALWTTTIILTPTGASLVPLKSPTMPES